MSDHVPYWRRGEPDSDMYIPHGNWAIDVIRANPMPWIRTSFEAPILCRLTFEPATCFVRNPQGRLCPLSENGYAKFAKSLNVHKDSLYCAVEGPIEPSLVKISFNEAQEEYLTQRPIDERRTQQIFKSLPK